MEQLNEKDLQSSLWAAADEMRAKMTADVYKDYSVFMNELDSSSINIRLIGYAKVKSFDAFVQIRSEIYTSVLKEFRANGIDFAFPSSTVYLAK